MYQIRTDCPDVNSASESFQQRQSDVFASLAGLEAAHNEVTKATKLERKAVQKSAWRRPVAAPEDLAAEKERRLRGQSPTDSRDTSETPEFRVPQTPIRARPHRARCLDRRDPSKWTHYSLEGVDEDGPSGQSNFSIASQFISDLRERRSEDTESGEKREHRILFRPVRGTKRSRPDPSEANVVSNRIIPAGMDSEDTTQSSPPLDSPSLSTERSESIAFVHRQSRGRIRARSVREPDSPPAPTVTPDTPLSEEDPTDEADIETDFLT